MKLLCKDSLWAHQSGLKLHFIRKFKKRRKCFQSFSEYQTQGRQKPHRAVLGNEWIEYMRFKTVCGKSQVHRIPKCFFLTQSAKSRWISCQFLTLGLRMWHLKLVSITTKVLRVYQINSLRTEGRLG